MSRLFAILFVLWSAFAIAECDSSIQPSDTIGAVKAKLNCFAAENSKLKSELSAKTDIYAPMRIVYTSAKFEAQPLQADCVNKAVSTLVERHWKVVVKNSRLAELSNKNNSVVVDCRHRQVLVAGPDLNEAADIARLVEKLLFDKP